MACKLQLYCSGVIELLFYLKTLILYYLYIAQEKIRELVLVERVETLVPLTYMACFLMAYYGPNAEILGSIKLTIWNYEAISDIEKFLQNLSLLVGIDFMSGVVTGILLYVTCKINVFRTLKMIQKKMWLMMAVLEGHLFMEVI